MGVARAAASARSSAASPASGSAPRWIRRIGRSCDSIAAIRTALATTRCATTAGYGPRFLHSTGQLHKGGPATGFFLQLTSDHPADREIPGWPYTFGRLVDAQARGDREALRAQDRPVVHIHLGADLAADLATLEQAIGRALG